MNLHYVKNKAIDKARWDDCITHAANGNGYAYSWYLDAVADQWDAFILGDYEAIMPLPFNRKIVGFKQVYQPFFTQQLGVFYKERKEGNQLEVLFIEALKKHFSYFNIAFNEGNMISTEKELEIEEKPNLLLKLNNTQEELTQQYSRSLKRRLKKITGLHSLEKNTFSAAELVDFYRQHLQTKVNLSDVVYQKATQLISKALEQKHGTIYIAKLEDDKIGAAGFFLESHSRIINLFGASSEVGRSQYSMHFLLDSIIKTNANTSQVFDFEGSAIPSIAHFFASFGSSPVTYHRVTYNGLPKALKGLKK